METWMPVCDFEKAYEVSNLGRIRRIGKGKGCRVGIILKPYLSTHGYLCVKLSKNGEKAKHYSVHRTVLEAFTEKKPRTLDVRHKDGNRTNNNFDNLCWGTRAENMQDAAEHGRTNRGIKNFSNKLSEADVIEIFHSKGVQHVIAKRFNVGQGVVSRIRAGKAWSWLTSPLKNM